MTIKKIGLIIFFATILATTTLVNIRPALSQGTVLYLSPAIVHQTPSKTFTLNVTVSSAEFLYVWQANITFNPAVLKVNTITEGEFLSRQPNGTTGAKKIEASWAIFGWTTNGPFVGESGSGTLATVEFEVLAEGESLIAFDRTSKTFLRAQTSPNPPPDFDDVDFTMQDAVFTNLVTPPVANFEYSPLIPGINQQITFDASTSNATAPMIITQYVWDFDDGTNATVTTPVTTHAFAAGGLYTVSLTVIDNATASALVTSVFNTTGMPPLWYELYSTKTTNIGVAIPHDLEVTNVVTSSQEVTAGDTVSITVTVMNKGTEAETAFSVTAYYDSSTAGTGQGTDLASGQQKDVVISWNTAGVAEGDYRIKAVAATVSGEVDVQNNEFIDGTVKVKLGTPFPTTLVIGGAAVAVVIVALAAVFFWRRGKSSPSSPK